MAIVKFINKPKSQTPAGTANAMKYIMQDFKTIAEDGRKYVSGVNCNPATAQIEFENTKRLFGKTDGRQHYHFIQSFPVGEDITPETAHEIALRFIQETEKFRGYEVVVATHCERDHIHSHFVMNSVNMESGRKFHITENEVYDLMKQSDRIISEYGLSICQATPGNVMKGIGNNEMHSLMKQDSWKLELAITVDSCMKMARSKEHYISLMEDEGYSVRWTEERKNITYTCPNGKKCRDNKLHDERYTKERMENEFRIRAEIIRRLQERSYSLEQRGGKSRAGRYSDRKQLEGYDSTEQYIDRMAGAYIRDTSGAVNERGNDSYAGKSGGNADGRKPADGNRTPGSWSDDTGELREYPFTGWENERREWLVFERSQTQNDEFYASALRDFNSGLLDNIISGAYLVADIQNIIQEDEGTEDCTTKNYTPHHSKEELQKMRASGIKI